MLKGALTATDPGFRAAVSDVKSRLSHTGVVRELLGRGGSRHSRWSSSTSQQQVEKTLAAVAAAQTAHPQLKIEEFGDASAGKALSKSFDSAKGAFFAADHAAHPHALRDPKPLRPDAGRLVPGQSRRRAISGLTVIARIGVYFTGSAVRRSATDGSLTAGLSGRLRRSGDRVWGWMSALLSLIALAIPAFSLHTAVRISSRASPSRCHGRPRT